MKKIFKAKRYINTQYHIPKLEVISIPLIGVKYENYIFNRNPKFKELMDKYSRNNRSPETVSTFSRAISKILKVVGKEKIDKLTIKDFDKYKDYRKSNNFSVGVTIRHLTIAKIILKQLGKKRLAKKIELPKKPDTEDNYTWCTEAEIDQLYDATTEIRNRRYGERLSLMYRAILSVGYFAGLRGAEAVNLKIGDVVEIEKGRYQIMVRHGKGDKDAVVPLKEQAYNDIQRWYKVRYTPKDSTDNEYIFIGRSGTKLNRGSANRIIKLLGSIARIPKRIYFHCLRHSIATHLAIRGCSEIQIKVILRHSKATDTYRYLHVAMQHISPAYDTIKDNLGSDNNAVPENTVPNIEPKIEPKPTNNLSRPTHEDDRTRYETLRDRFLRGEMTEPTFLMLKQELESEDDNTPKLSPKKEPSIYA